MGGVTQVTIILVKEHIPCEWDHTLSMAGWQEPAHKFGQFLLIALQLAGEVVRITSEQEPNHLLQESSAEGGKEWAVMEAAVHLILRGWQMHPSVRETPEGAPQLAVLILGEGLHIL